MTRYVADFSTHMSVDREDPGIFTRRTAIILAVASGLGLAITLFAVARAAGKSEGDRIGANSYSYSAIGYRALLETLKISGARVVRSRDARGSRTPAGGIILAEPTYGEGGEALIGLLNAAKLKASHVVVVLPKWKATEDPHRRGWLAKVSPLSASEPARVLGCVLGGQTWHGAQLESPSVLTNWQASFKTPLPLSLPYPQLLPPLPNVTPLLWVDQGVVVGRVNGTKVIVVSDPHLFNNQWLIGNNAVAAQQLLLEVLREQRWAFDETLHGFRQRGSFWNSLTTYPLILVVMHGLGLMLLTVWSTFQRLGAPLNLPRSLRDGTESLIWASVGLLKTKKNVPYVLRRYLQLIVRDVAQLYHLPASLSLEASLTRLSEIEKNRSSSESILNLDREAGHIPNRSHSSIQLAHRLWRWREEMTHGR